MSRWHDRPHDVDGRSLSELIQRNLTEAITQRLLRPGWRLSEERLSRLFGVSRTPVREALAGLAGTGLAHRDKRGTLRVGAVTPEQVQHVHAVRRALEGLSAALAAEAATPSAIRRIKERNEACERAAADGDIEEYARANLDFHAEIARATGNETLMRFIDEIQNWVRRTPMSAPSHPRIVATAGREHTVLIDAIERRDATSAGRLARCHMQLSQRMGIERIAGDRPVACESRG